MDTTNTTIIPADLISPNAASQALTTSPATVRRWINAGKLPAFKIGGRLRVSRADVLAMVRRVETVGPMLPTRAEVEAKAAWVDETLRAAGIRK